MSTPTMRAKCSEAGCKRLNFALGLCQAHYQQRRRRPEASTPLHPIRAVVGVTRSVLTTRISPEARSALGRNPSTRAQEIIEAWARRHPGPPVPPPQPKQQPAPPPAKEHRPMPSSKHYAAIEATNATGAVYAIGTTAEEAVSGALRLDPEAKRDSFRAVPCSAAAARFVGQFGGAPDADLCVPRSPSGTVHLRSEEE